MSLDLHHHREGAGEPLVLLHGIGHHWQLWAPVIPALARDFDVIAVDSPGFGRSRPLPDGVGGIHDYADAFVGWFAELGLERPHVAGNSMGGAIALELVRRGAVRTATAVSPAGFWNAGELAWAEALLKTLAGLPEVARPAVLAALRTTAGRAAFMGALVARPGRYPAQEAQATCRDAWAAPAFEAVLAAFRDYDVVRGDELEGVPVTVAWGSRDLLLPYWRQAPRARSVLPRAHHVTLPGLGHVPCTDDPGMVADVVRAGALRTA